MATVNFPAYRAFERFRVEANDAGVAIVLGLQIARMNLQALAPATRARRLPEVYDPARVDSARLNLPIDDVVAQMEHAELFLGYMQITYAVAVFNEFLVVLLEMFQEDGVNSGVDFRSESLQQLRDRARLAAGLPASEYTELMDFVQRLRNDIAHGSGVATQKLLDRWAALSDAAKRTWRRIATGHQDGPDPVLVVGERVALGAGEARAALAVTHRIATDLNERCASKISKAVWARVAVADYAMRYPDSWKRSADRRIAQVSGYATNEYGSVGLSKAELARAVSAHV